MSFAAQERELLCDEFLTVGPDAPTLCAGWDAYDLACHLWVREHDPKSLPGMFVDRFVPLTDERMARARKRMAFPEVVGQLRAGPPGQAVMRRLRIDDLLNTMEFFVHHEDLRRAVDPSAPPRDLHENVETVWRGSVLFSRRLLLGCPVGVTLVRTDRPGRRTTVKRERGHGEVSLIGGPVEVGLYLFGRRSCVNVNLAGTPGAVDEFKRFTLRI